MPIICPFVAAAPTADEALEMAMRGQGMLGIGGATGAGKAAKAGYHGIPFTLMPAVYASHAVLSVLAMAFEYFISCGVAIGALARMSGPSGGPTTWPPTAVTALITTPTIVAALCHWLQAEQIALQMPSRYFPIT